MSASITKLTTVPSATETYVPLDRPQRPVIVDLARLDGIEGVRIVSDQIGHWIKKDPKHNRLGTLARRANLGNSTVSKIYSRETFSPRMTTLMYILRALGFSAVRFE